MAGKNSGSCQCGSVRYEVPQDMKNAGKCHCLMCQKSTGSGSSTVVFYDINDLKVTGETKTYTYTSDRGNAVTSHFCPKCGTKLFLTGDTGFPGLALVLAGTLDDNSNVKPQFVVFDKRCPAWDSDDPSIPHFAEMPPG